jgi:hypothetical protein
MDEMELKQPCWLIFVGETAKWKKLLEEGEAALIHPGSAEGVTMTHYLEAKNVLKQMNDIQEARKKEGKQGHVDVKKVWHRLQSVLGGARCTMAQSPISLGLSEEY